tara:strand:- start:611 stop:850 length:240 start_codon:yes stop_codon:yes gene_type:complete
MTVVMGATVMGTVIETGDNAARSALAEEGENGVDQGGKRGEEQQTAEFGGKSHVLEIALINRMGVGGEQSGNGFHDACS